MYKKYKLWNVNPYRKPKDPMRCIYYTTTEFNIGDILANRWKVYQID